MEPRKIKCLVWDLDNTLWRGTLLEGDTVEARDDIRHIVRTLDERGILQSIASKNEPADALAKLRDLGLEEYFLYPQIGWGAKSAAIKKLTEQLNLGLDSFAFVDDQRFELEEVRFALPDVLCIPTDELHTILERDEFLPTFVTEDSKNRRRLYQLDIARKTAQDSFEGPQEAFLATLQMKFTIAPATERDLQRAEELTLRTHQLNTTGYTYGYDELDAFRRSASHQLLLCELEDRFGPYGKIGLALVEMQPEGWLIKLLLMSCRVVGRGVGTILLHHIMGQARAAGLPTRAEFRLSGRNEMMLTTYRFAGFREIGRDGDLLLLESKRTEIPSPPSYVTVVVHDLHDSATME